MARPDKVAVVTDVRERLESSNATLLSEYRGLTVADLAALRAQLREQNASYRVVKNRLTRLAAQDAGLEIPDDVLTGPTAVTFCDGDPVAVAKALRQFSREHPQLVIKGGVMEGNFLDAGETLRLADLASREELLAQFAGAAQSVVAKPARLAYASLSRAARVIQALLDQRGGAPEDAAGAQEPPTDADAAPDEAASASDVAPDEAASADAAPDDAVPADAAPDDATTD